jgi:glycosyltransferase involved in cell wall biosynthesis
VPVYSGIDEDLIADAGVIENKKQPHTLPLRLLYAGKLIERKRADDLIRAVRQLDFPWMLTIVGDGPEMGTFLAAAGGDPRILFKGQLSREETVACMQEADAFLMVSTGETFGLVYLEAMGQGCITVASRGEGIDGVIIDGENGYLVPAGDIGAIKDVICRIRDLTGEEKGQIIQKGYDLARTMTSMQTSKRYFEANR